MQYAQEYTLEIRSLLEVENKILSKIDYTKKHVDSVSIYTEIKKIQKRIKLEGYFFSDIQFIDLKNKIYHFQINLDQKIETLSIVWKNIPAVILKKSNFKNDTLNIKVNESISLLQKFSNLLEQQGDAFSTLKLIPLKIEKKTLFAKISYVSSTKRTINKIVFKGYTEFPKSFVQNYFNVNNNTIFNKATLNKISNLTKSLDFATEIKPPETLFTKDATTVFVYLKKDSGSSFDGLINFSSKESGAVQFNGYLDLKLKNILNKGEQFNLQWNRFENDRQEFTIATKLPYLFNTKFSPEFKFSIYRQDSTFTSTMFSSKLKYQIKEKSNIFISYDAENSEQLKEDSPNNIATFNNYFIGLGYAYNRPNRKAFNTESLYININPSFGSRTQESMNSKQIRFSSEISYVFKLNDKNSIYSRNMAGILMSDEYLTNELFRIGGPNSVRGFNQQSIFVRNYLIQNIEYRYKTSNTSYFYTITDLAAIATTQTSRKLIGLGIGYLFTSKNSEINISTSIGTDTETPFDLRNSQLFINWINFF